MTTAINTSNTTLQNIIVAFTFAFLFLGTAVTANAQLNAPDYNQIDLKSIDIEFESKRTPESLTKAEWSDYSERLKGALMNEQTGLQQSALQNIIRYGSYFDNDKETVFEIVSIYRNHEDDQMRRMAVVALGELEDAWAMNFLKRAVRFETSPEVAHTTKYVLKNYDGSYQ